MLLLFCLKDRSLNTDSLRYLTRADESPLFDALPHWRHSTLHFSKSTSQYPTLSPTPSYSSPNFSSPTPSRPSSPFLSSDMEDDDDRKTEATTPPTSADEGDDFGQRPKPKPTSSSWVKWWSRSKQASGSSPVGNNHPLPTLAPDSPPELRTSNSDSLLVCSTLINQ